MKNFQRFRLGLVTLILTLISASANAGMTPLGVAIFAPVQFPPEDFYIVGARVSALLGRHRGMYGIDLGAIGNITDQNFVGIAASGIFNITKGQTTIIGLQAAGIANANSGKTSIYGLQVAAGFNSNTAESSLVGLQVGLGNNSPFTKVYGIQAGIYNSANHVYGFQIGIVNVAQSLHGIQIGVINFNRTGIFSVAPILNVGF